MSDESEYLEGSLVGFLDHFITPIFAEQYNRNYILYESDHETSKIKSINGLPFLNKRDQVSDGAYLTTIKTSATRNYTYITDDLQEGVLFKPYRNLSNHIDYLEDVPVSSIKYYPTAGDTGVFDSDEITYS